MEIRTDFLSQPGESARATQLITKFLFLHFYILLVVVAKDPLLTCGVINLLALRLLLLMWSLYLYLPRSSVPPKSNKVVTCDFVPSSPEWNRLRWLIVLLGLFFFVRGEVFDQMHPLYLHFVFLSILEVYLWPFRVQTLLCHHPLLLLRLLLPFLLLVVLETRI